MKAMKWVIVLPLLALPVVAQAQYNYITNNGTITITNYTGSGGAVTIPNTLNGLQVTSIGNYAFRHCTSLTSVTIPNSVTGIGEGAFWVCSSLTSVTIPNSVTGIGNAAFVACTGLTGITIPNSVISLGEGVFWGCSGLIGAYFKGNAPSLTVSDPAFEGATNSTIYYLAGTTGWANPWSGRPTTLALWDFGVQNLGNGWRGLSWFGNYAPLGSSWIWHNEHGYMYCFPSSPPQSIYFYTMDMGWLWTSSTVYPYLYRFSGASWLWYLSGSNSPRWFYNFNTQNWESWYQPD